MEKVIVIDFGGQYNQLVARRVRENRVYCEIYSYRTPLDTIRAMEPKGIILTGGPASCYEEGAATCPPELFSLGIPVLGLCYGAQLMMHVLGGRVEKAPVREYGKTALSVDTASPLFSGVPAETTCFMSHFDYIAEPAPSFRTIAWTENCPYAAVSDSSRNLYGFQFHPEVLHTPEGSKMLRNFVYEVCDCSGDWKMEDFAERQIKVIRERVGSGRVLLALSGGVDSSVAAVLLSKAVGRQLTCVFVDHGLLRKNEGDEVEAVFGPEGPYDLNFIRVNAASRYYEKLKGVSEPEKKRKIIGEEFIRVFEEEARKIGAVDFLVQGTIYPDVVESGLGGESAVIKSHHNVGGLPEHVDFKEIIEPLRDLFKDEVRKVGLTFGIPENLVFRQPFPGPGLGIRIIGEVTAEKVRIVQDADAIYREEIAKAAAAWRNSIGRATGEPHQTTGTDGAGAERGGETATRADGEVEVERGGEAGTRVDGDAEAKRGGEAATATLGAMELRMPPWMPDQYFAALTNMRSVGVMGDERTYDYAVALRAVKTIDFMTAEAAEIPFEVLQTVMNRIINEVKGVNRVMYDLTSKPPGTIELE